MPRRVFICTVAAACLVVGFSTGLMGQKKFALTIDNIMRGNALYGYEPTGVRWSGDSQQIYFQWKQYNDARDKPMDTYVVNRDGTGLRKLSDDETKNAPPLGGDGTRDHHRMVYAQDGDVFLYDFATGKRHQITNTTDAEMNPHFTQDEEHIYFTRGGNLYVMALDTGSLVQMTDIRTPGSAPLTAAPMAGEDGGRVFGFGRAQATARTGEPQQRGTDSQEYLKKEGKELLEVVKEREARRDEDEARRKKEHPRKPFTLQPRQTVAALQLTPDEKYVIATIREAGDRAKNTIVPNFVSDSAYTEDIPGRTKVGDSQPRIRLAILSVETGDVKWVDHGQKLPPAAAAEKKEGAGEGRRMPPQSQEREVHLTAPIWSEDGSKAVLMGRAADNKDRWIFALDIATGKTRVLFTDHDDAWIDGPGAFTLGWLKDNEHIYFQSERDGYAHLYTVPFNGGEPKQLTSGKYEVTRVELSRDKSKFYLTTSEVGPGERHFYSMNTDSSGKEQITRMPGNHRAELSPDEKWIADIYSYTNKPPELYVQPNEPGAAAAKLTSSPAPEFWDYPWIDVPIIHFRARDGVMVPARFYRPANFQRGGPAVIFVHGAGYAQNVHRWWSSYAPNFLFHHFLMEHGYMVLDIDYRASAGYGRDWRTAVYRHMGGKDLDDQVDGAGWMVEQQGVDPKRIGIYGGSYGGFITLMAMFTQPDVFAAGAALRPVSDWAHYNNGYTSNILNLPQKDSEAYRESSPIYFAQNLKGGLLICHGMVDTNVHFQDTVRLVQRLIELRKENWELAVYPVENHGFVQPTSWADEYKRIFALFERNLKKGMK